MKNERFDREADYLFELIAEEFRMDVALLKSRTRIREVVSARRIFCVVFKEAFGDRVTQMYIGELIGNMNHTTVTHALKVHREDTEMRGIDKRLDTYFEVYDKVYVEFMRAVGKTIAPSIKSIRNLKNARRLMDDRIEKMEIEFIIQNHRGRLSRSKMEKEERRCNKILKEFVY